MKTKEKLCKVLKVLLIIIVVAGLFAAGFFTCKTINNKPNVLNSLALESIDSVAIFTKENFVGDEFIAPEGNSDYNSKPIWKTSSIYVPYGYKVTLYSKENYQGDSYELTESVTSLGNWDNKAESVKIEYCAGEELAVSELNDEAKVKILNEYAPKFWIAKDEKYMPSSIEYAINSPATTIDEENNIFVDGMVKGDEIIDYFYGDLSTAKVYSYWVDKSGDYVDLVYFVFCPYNESKKIAGKWWNNHIGDWEHASVRIKVTESGVVPVKVAYQTHSFVDYAVWSDAEKEGTHPVVYISKGSHGMWKQEGDNAYFDIGVFKLVDECSKGTAWNSWENDTLETYTFDPVTKTGAGLGDTEWTGCFEYENPTINRWGNKKLNSTLSDGPEGPQRKIPLKNYIEFK